MVQLRRGLRLAQEARLDLAAERELGRQDLDGDGALEAAIFRPIDDAHPAAPDLAVQLVVRAEHALDVRAQLGVRRRYDGIRQASGSGIWADGRERSILAPGETPERTPAVAAVPVRQARHVSCRTAARVTDSD